MGADYRDELSAAHARIAELEDKVRALESERERPEATAIRFPELEAAVERARKPADEKRNARTNLTIQLTGAAAGIASAVFAFLDHPLFASCMSVVLIATVVAGFVVRGRLAPAKRVLADATQRLADARRLHLLEQKLAARPRVEIDGGPEELLSDAEGEPSAHIVDARNA